MKISSYLISILKRICKARSKAIFGEILPKLQTTYIHHQMPKLNELYNIGILCEKFMVDTIHRIQLNLLGFMRFWSLLAKTS